MRGALPLPDSGLSAPPAPARYWPKPGLPVPAALKIRDVAGAD